MLDMTRTPYQVYIYIYEQVFGDSALFKCMLMTPPMRMVTM